MADRRRRGLAALALLSLALPALAGCGSSGEDGSAGSVEAPLNVGAAVKTKPEGVVQVRGALHSDSGHVRLCAALAESFPPQCTAPSLRVHGLHLDAVPGIQTSPDESILWAPSVVVQGRIVDGELSVGS